MVVVAVRGTEGRRLSQGHTNDMGCELDLPIHLCGDMMCQRGRVGVRATAPARARLLQIWPSHRLRAKRILCLEGEEGSTEGSSAVHVLDSALEAGLCLQELTDSERRHILQRITQVPGGSGATGPTQTLLGTAEAFARQMAISPFSIGKPQRLHSWFL